MRFRALLSFILFFVSGFAVAQTSVPASTPERVAALDRLKSLVEIPVAEWRYHEGDLVNGAAPDLDDSTWKSMKVGEILSPNPAWLRTSVEIPGRINGYSVQGASARLMFRTDLPEGFRVFVNGVQVAGGESGDPVPLITNVNPGQKLLIAILRLGETYDRRLGPTEIEFEVAAGRPDPSVVRQEFLSAEAMIQGFSQGQEEREQQLDAALRVINWKALESGEQQSFDRSLIQAREKLFPIRDWMRQYSVHAVGNSHIDMAWLWPWTETVDVTKRTFSSALQLMREFPDFTFTMASARTYSWMEEKYPKIFAEIRQRVREGRWEPIGGMWVEPDLNMPDGESLVRQILVGKRYFNDKFGVDIRTGWNPDSFGYNWQLPQIYKKSGIDFFVTQKISWNETTKFPHKLFWWQAPDGSRVLTYFPDNYVNPIHPVPIAKDVAEYTQKTGWPEMLYLYGVGDHGGGPTRAMLQNAARYRKPDSVYPNLKIGTAQAFFDKLERKADGLNLPVWNDELYLEYHRGVLTTQGETKKNNRRSEVLMLNAEKFASLATLFGKPYPQQELNDAWKKVLFNQFHDILPGSGISDVYVDASRDYEEVRRQSGKILQTSLNELVDRIDTRGAGVPIVIFNPVSWKRTDVVEANVQFAKPALNVEVLDANGKPVLAEVVRRSPDTNRITVRFTAREIPSLGYGVFHAVPVATASKVKSPIRVSGNVIENEYYRVQVNHATGCMTSVFDKTHNKEAIEPGACGNLLQAFGDKPQQWDAWNIDADFELKSWNLDKAEEVKVIEQSPLRAVLRVRKKFQKSSFVQDIIVQAGVPRVDVAMKADWHEKHILLKVAFPVAVRNDFATYEIPFGSIQRPTTRRTPEEKAKFEVPALRWADLSDAQYGVSLLNDSKYGYDTKNNVLRLSLLRSPEDPDPHADEGKHEWTYSIYGHAGSWKNASTVRQGYELNNKLIAVAAQVHGGSLPSTHSFVQVTPNNVVLSAIKKSEDDGSLLLRFYEFAGEQTEARISVSQTLTSAVETNLMEKEEGKLKLEKDSVLVPTKPYEIKSVRLQFSNGVSKAEVE